MRSVLDIVIVISLVVGGYLAFTHLPFQSDFMSKAQRLGVSTTTNPIIKIIKPLPGQHFSKLVKVEGKARTSENHLNIRIKDIDSGKILMEDEVTVISPKLGEYGKWNYEFSAESIKDGQKIKIEAFNYSLTRKEINKDTVSILIWRD